MRSLILFTGALQHVPLFLPFRAMALLGDFVVRLVLFVSASGVEIVLLEKQLYDLEISSPYSNCHGRFWVLGRVRISLEATR